MQERLWGGIRLPQWSLDRCYALFERVNSGSAINSLERDEFAKLLMHVITNHLGTERSLRSLERADIEPEEAASCLLEALSRKSATMKLNHPCPLVLMKVYDLSMRRDLISLIRQRQRREGDAEVSSIGEAEHGDPASASPVIGGVYEAILAAQEQLCGDDPVVSPFFRHCAASMARGHHLPSLDRLPKRFKDRITADAYIYVVFRLNRFVRQYAANLVHA